MIGGEKGDKRSELCRAWGKVRDEHCLLFFDNGAKANFISSELAAKLGICLEEMGPICDANTANPKLSTPITPIIGKLHILLQDYVGLMTLILCHCQTVMYLWGYPGIMTTKLSLMWLRKL